MDIGPLIEAELDRRYPGRAKMRPASAAGFREAWDILERLWDGTVARARSLPPDALHESVGGEWSFIETMRQLVFATEAWVRRAILGDPSPWDALSLRDCLLAVLREEWEHRLYAERDLAVLRAGR